MTTERPTWHPHGWLAYCAITLIGLLPAANVRGADPAETPDTGIELTGRSNDDPPPYSWQVYAAEADRGGKKPLVQISRKWGAAPLPAGEYRVTVTPEGSGAVEITWGKFKVEEKKITSVEINSGIEVAGRSPEDKPPGYWYVYDSKGKAKDKKPLAVVYYRFGFTPLPPGDYSLGVLPEGGYAVEVAWSTFKVEEGKVASIALSSGVELAGRTEEDKPPQYTYVYDSKGKQKDTKPLAVTYHRWGFTPLPPGDYTLSVHPEGAYAVEIPWTAFKVEKEKIARVAINSGVEISGRSEEDKPPQYTYVYDAKGKEKNKKPLAVVSGRWGYTPLPPGDYSLSVQPEGAYAQEIAWTRFTVDKEKIASVAIKSGLEFQGRSEDDTPPLYAYVYEASAKERNRRPIATMNRRFGFTPLPPGDYALSILPEGTYAVEIPWAHFKVETDKLVELRADSGVELSPTAEDDPPPEYWYVFAAGARKAKERPIAVVYKRWGFTPVPPGRYDIISGKSGLLLDVVELTSGKVADVRIPDLKQRLARVTGANRKAEKELDPQAYAKLEEAVERAIRKGAAWVKQHRLFADAKPEYAQRDEYLSIGVLALVHAGEFERDPELGNQCLDYLMRRTLNTSHGTYANALNIMALRDIAPYRFSLRCRECAQWLVENQSQIETGTAWTYGRAVPGLGEFKPLEPREGRSPRGTRRDRPAAGPTLEVVRQGLVTDLPPGWDNSCTQFAVLGLHSAAHAGVKLPRDLWQRVAAHFASIQDESGGWGYGRSGPTGSMTCAGLASYVIARHHLGAENLTLDPAVVAGLEWLAGHFTVEENPQSTSNHYYYLYGLERVGVLAGTSFFGEHEWYPTGARFLVDEQKENGSWNTKTSPSSGSYDDYLDTCYAILFLRRATLPPAPVQPALLRVTGDQAEAAPEAWPAVDFILDSSGSMQEKMEGKAKNVVAREVIEKLLKDLPGRIQVGLRLYGHWGQWLLRKADPKAAMLNVNDPRLDTDSELVVPIAPLDDAHRKKVGTWLDWAQPRGKTPMVYSLLAARGDFKPVHQGPRTVVLISDGKETCGGKIEDVGRAYKDAGIDVVVHVVGFDIRDSEDQKQLSQIARLGGGLYFNATDAGELIEALRAAVVTRYDVLDEATGRTIDNGEINGEPLTLPAGRYRVQLVGSKKKAQADVLLEVGKTHEITVTPQGELRDP